jgi:hypothetical protein
LKHVLLPSSSTQMVGTVTIKEAFNATL